MSAIEITGGFGTLRTEVEQIEITSNLPQPDQSWRYTDAQGHEHYWRDGWPTLRTVVDKRYWCADCNDEHMDSHLECARCGETIKPGMTGPPLGREFMPGRTSYWLDGEPISEERAREIMDLYRRNSRAG